MQPRIGKFSRYAGEDYHVEITIYEKDEVTPQDITGWLLKYAFHPINDPIDSVSKTTGSGIIHNLPYNVPPQATVTILAADTANLTPGLYQIRVERIDAGVDNVLYEGIFTLKRK